METFYDKEDLQNDLNVLVYCKNMRLFIEDVFEIAHGDDAINKDFSFEETLETLKDYAEKSWQYEELEK